MATLKRTDVLEVLDVQRQWVDIVGGEVLTYDVGLVLKVKPTVSVSEGDTYKHGAFTFTVIGLGWSGGSRPEDNFWRLVLGINVGPVKREPYIPPEGPQPGHNR